MDGYARAGVEASFGWMAPMHAHARACSTTVGARAARPRRASPSPLAPAAQRARSLERRVGDDVEMAHIDDLSYKL